VKPSNSSKREKALKAIKESMGKDKADPSRLSKWLKLMDCKKQLFSLEDQIDKLTRQLHEKKSKRT